MPPRSSRGGVSHIGGVSYSGPAVRVYSATRGQIPRLPPQPCDHLHQCAPARASPSPRPRRRHVVRAPIGVTNEANSRLRGDSEDARTDSAGGPALGCAAAARAWRRRWRRRTVPAVVRRAARPARPAGCGAITTSFVVQEVLGHTRVTTTERYTHAAVAGTATGAVQPPEKTKGLPAMFIGKALISGRRLGDLNPGWTVSPNRISSAAP